MTPYTIAELTVSARPELQAPGPTPVEQARLQAVGLRLIQLAHLLGERPRVASGWRSEANNRRVGGSRTSSHRLGLAVDVDTALDARVAAIVAHVAAVASGLPWDQVIAYAASEGGHLHLGLQRAPGAVPRGQLYWVDGSKKADGSTAYLALRPSAGEVRQGVEVLQAAIRRGWTLPRQ